MDLGSKIGEMKFGHFLLWILGAGLALDSMRPEAAKASLPVVGSVPTVIRGPAPGTGLFARFSSPTPTTV